MHPRSKALLALVFFSAVTLLSSGAERLRLIIETDAGGDPDDEQSLVRFLLYAWFAYPEATDYRGPAIVLHNDDQARAWFEAPVVDHPAILHVILAVTDTGEPALTRYQRLIMEVGRLR